MRKFKTREEEEEERSYRMQRRAVRDGVGDYIAWALFKKAVTNVVGGLLGLLLLYAYIHWDMSRIPAKHDKFVRKQAEKTMLFKQLEECKKTGDPKRKKCSDIWWKWVRTL